MLTHRSLKPRVPAIIALAFLSLVTGRAQPWGPLTADNPIVVDHLIHYHDAVANEIALRNAVDPRQAESRQLGVAFMLGITTSGYQSLGRVLGAAKANLDAVRSSQSKYLANPGVAGSPASMSTALGAFKQQELAILRSVPLDLKNQLSLADWTGLQIFIGKILVSSIRVGMATPNLSPPLPILPPGTNLR